MPYLMSDDGMPDNQKVDALSDGAFRLYISAMHYCARELSDGAVPHRRTPRLTPHYKASHLRELVNGGLAHEGTEGCGTSTCIFGQPGEWVVHDYLQWNKSAAWWTERRIKEAERIAKWRATKSAEELA
jgi:hypothetical protein